MRKITVLSMITLDGVMQAPGARDEDTSGDFKFGGWTALYSDEHFRKLLQEELQQAADYILGRQTFEIFESYWPGHADFWPGINDGTKYVFSQTRNKSEWKNTVFVKTPADIERLKETEGNDIQVWGSGKLVHLLFKHDLVDELRLKIYPLILGGGKKLFENGAVPSAFTLTETHVTSKGVIIANYRRAGEVITGTVEV